MNGVVCDSVSIRRGGVWLLRRVTLTVQPGEIVGVVSRRRAERVMLLRIVAGRMRPGSGLVQTPVARVGGAAFVADPPAIPGELTGLEWLRYLAAREAAGHRERVEWIRRVTLRANVGRRLRDRTSTWSSVEVRRLAVAAAVTGWHPVVVMVEAVGEIGPEVRDGVRRDLWRRPGTAALISGSPDDLAGIAQRIVVLHRGSVVVDGPTADVLGRKVLELEVGARALRDLAVLLDRRPGVRLGDTGACVMLSNSLTEQHVLALCRDRRLPVLKSRVRKIRMEELVQPGP